MLGASGYTGEEVVRLLALHPNFSVAALTGESQAGKASISQMQVTSSTFVLDKPLQYGFYGKGTKSCHSSENTAGCWKACCTCRMSE